MISGVYGLIFTGFQAFTALTKQCREWRCLTLSHSSLRHLKPGAWAVVPLRDRPACLKWISPPSTEICGLKEPQGNLSPSLGDLAAWEEWIENVAHEWWKCWHAIASGLSGRDSLLKSGQVHLDLCSSSVKTSLSVSVLAWLTAIILILEIN